MPQRPDLGALIAAARGRPVAPEEQLAIATSGGPDSLALLGLAASAFPGRITALTVDHGLRALSAAEAEGVAAQCAVRGIRHVTLRRDGPPITANVQAAARAARYALLASWCASQGVALLLTAHHADDQAETLLMRLNRGSGHDGLSGIRAARQLAHSVMLVRPLLACRKADLLALAEADGWRCVDDPSNRDPRHVRTGARALLAAAPGLDAGALAASAAHLAAEAEALDWAASAAWDGRVAAAGGELVMDARGLPGALIHRLLMRAVRQMGGGEPRGQDVARLAARLTDGKPATLAGVAARPGAIWRIFPAPPRQIRHQAG